jgi:hypothetical protein
MRCADARGCLSARVDGELTARTTARLDKHLEHCAACRAHAGALEALHRRVRIGVAPLPERGDPVPAIVARVVADEQAHPRVRTVARKHRSRAWGVAVAACLALVMLAAGVVAWSGRGGDDLRVATRAPGLAPAVGDHLLLVWTSGGLPPGFAARVRDVPGVRGVVDVRGDVLELDTPNGAVPIDTLAVDPSSYASLLRGRAAASVRSLRRGEVLLGATGAGLRDVEVGATLRFAGGTELRVAGVVPDDAASGAEAIVRADDATGVTTDRFVLVEYDGDRAELEPLLRETERGTPMRFRAPDETRFLRHGDAVLPLAAVKERFGEFAYRPGPGQQLVIDPQWLARNIVRRDLPVIGAVQCHRGVVDALADALRAVPGEARSTIAGPATCFDPHRGPAGLGPSRHAFGIEIAFTLPESGKGGAGIGPDVVRALERHGFTWGGRWLQPEPERFEYVGR